MSLVIVTENQYLIASHIHNIQLNELYDYVDIHRGYKRTTVKEFTHNIVITYSPENANGVHDTRECSVAIRGKINAHRVFRDLVSQIREQMPDKLYLDKAVENLFANHSIEDKSLSEVDYESGFYPGMEQKAKAVKNRKNNLKKPKKKQSRSK